MGRLITSLNGHDLLLACRILLGIPTVLFGKISQRMSISQLRNRTSLERYFRQNLPLHTYSLGDLDDFYWAQTTCFGVETSSGVDLVSVLYKGAGLPVLLSLTDSNLMDQRYFSELTLYLPDRFYAHFSPGLVDHFKDHHRISEYGDHFKMALENLTGYQLQQQTEDTFPLTDKDLPEINHLYRESYPDNAFDPRMLLTGQYLGLRRDQRLVSIAGIHVYSARYRVAALGNITTHPDYRGRGCARTVTASLCQCLAGSVDFIGLNVKCTNLPALSLYQSLGFRITGEYGEFSLQKQPK
jgi:ribosomal protein S18 acetylase RimI-like enzyme